MASYDRSRRHFLQTGAGFSALAAGAPTDAGLFTSLRERIAALFFSAAMQDGGGDGSMWPYVLEFDGTQVTVYTPQPEKLDGVSLSGRAAISAQMADQKAPIFGTAWFNARIEVDTEERTYAVKQVKVTRLVLPEADEELQQLTTAILQEGLSNFERPFELDPLLEQLATAEKTLKESQDLGTKPPAIVTVDKPAMLVSIDGAPKLVPVKEGSNVQRVINTPFAILQDPESKQFYLKGEEWWYVSDSPTGPWTETEGVPDAITAVLPKLPDEVSEESADARQTALEGEETPGASPPRPFVVTATEPTELIWTDGATQWKPVPDTQLQYAANSSGNVIKGTDGKIYTVLSGRWYTGPSLEGPWTYVASDRLPPDFAKIPKDTDVAGVLPFVAGTDEAQAAVTSQSVPTTAAVRKDATTRVNWAGDPQFNDITGTSMRASENAGTPVIKVGNQYYACQEGVWYLSNEPNGTYTVAQTVPPVIYTIPPQHPFYFITFVRVFGTGEDVVHTGYYPGYKGSYQLGNTVVNGTGYTYPPVIVNNVYIHQPAPPTWGFMMVFNPWFGWSVGLNMGFGMGAGWFMFSVGPRSPWWGPARFSPWWRPPFRAGFRPPFGVRPPMFRPPFVPVYRPGGGINRPGGVNRPGGGVNRPGGGGYYGGYQPSNRPRPAPQPGGVNNIYNRPSNQDRVRPSTRPGAGSQAGGGNRPTTLPNVGGKPGQPANRPTTPGTRPMPSPTNRPEMRPSTKPNNVYSDRNGQVWRDSPNGWQQNNKGNWQTQKPGSYGPGGATTRPAPAYPGGTTQRPTTRPAPSPEVGAAAAGRDRTGYRNPGASGMSGGTSRPAPNSRPSYQSPPSSRPAPTSRPSYQPPPSSRPAPTSRPSGGGSRPSGGGSRPSGGRR
jgi:hypothetical protein